jgi:hypothetical protein
MNAYGNSKSCTCNVDKLCNHTTLETRVGSLVKNVQGGQGGKPSEIEKVCSLILHEMTIGPSEEYIRQLD